MKATKITLKVDYDTSIQDQCKELGITNWLNLDKVTHLFPRPENDTIYDVEDGTEMLGKSVETAEKEFATKGRRGLTVHEVLALIRANPNVLKDHYIDCAGSRYHSGSVPAVWLNGSEPRLDYSYLDGSLPEWGAASCGSAGTSDVGPSAVSVPETLAFDGKINGTRYVGKLNKA